ncbi:MAG: PEP-CTERM sorting domain-containing protein [Leptolyngbyaceae cyanobacterium SL_5_9]|nr:PEP-CTERM sorting domain-containing protein [Leptolyngbyaceae cyanobacterium SL_5_9]
MSALVTALSPLQAQAFTFTEVDDAGESLSTAQVIPSGSSLLESISGTLSGFDDPADLFQISLTSGQSFFASTVSGADFDTRLFLFDADGVGIYFNDDSSSGTLQSTLPANSSFTPTQSGIYYLGISGFDYNPVNAAGERIFPSFTDFPVDVPAENIFTGVFGPTGPGGDAPLSGFDGAILNSGGSYTISLSQAEAVPEPSSILALLMVGASGTALQLRSQRKQKHNQA